MRYFDQGCFYSVQVSTAEVQAFKHSWPCSGLPSKSVTFQFDRDGNLIDITPYRYAGSFDGPAAVALSQDAQAYGEKRARAQR